MTSTSKAPTRTLHAVKDTVERAGATAAEYPIHGWYDPRFSAVVDAFKANFLQVAPEVEEVGASACVMFRGECVVDLWGGYADRALSRPWTRDTLTAIRSSSKGLCGIAVNMLADRGVLELDAPVARYWPEFAQAGKETLPLRYVLDHRAGLPVLEEPLWPGAIYDWDAMTGALARQAPFWTPGEQAGYHTFTQGYILGEVVRRSTGATIGQFIRSQIADPLRADVAIGLTDQEEQRCAEFLDVVEGTVYDAKASPSPFATRLRTQFPTDLQANSSEWRRSEIPSSNGHANARGLAITMTALIGEAPHRLVSAASLERLRTVQHDMFEIVGQRQIRQGLGVIVNSPPWAYFGPSPDAFGVHGFGGSLAMADVQSGLVIAYAMNNPHRTIMTGPRSRRIVNAAYSAL